MNTPTVSVSGVTLPYIEYHGTPVVTFPMIDAAHQRPSRTSRRNFDANKHHFIEGEDFYRVDSKSLHEIRASYPGLFPEAMQQATFFSETGYLMLVKSFTDDLAWQVQRQLVKSYFRTHPDQPSAAPPIPTPIDHHQRAELAAVADQVFEDFAGMRQSATGWFYNGVRSTYSLRRIEDLSRDDFPAVMDRLHAHRRDVRRYLDFRYTLQQAFLKDVIGDGYTWTAWLAKQAGGAQNIGKRPDWPQIARDVLQHGGLLPRA